MGRDLSRRKVAAYLVGTALCTPGTIYAQSVSLRPRSRPGSVTTSEIDHLVKSAGITGELGVSAINLESGEVIYERNHNQSFAPASILKVFTALYALETLGPNFRYSTRVLADGSIKNGHLSGNLYLVGSGDPMLNTDHLFALAKKVKAAQARTKTKQARTVKLAAGGTSKSKSRVNEAGNYTKPGMRKRIFNRIKAGGKGGAPGQWSARKAQMVAAAYKKAGGGYK